MVKVFVSDILGKFYKVLNIKIMSIQHKDEYDEHDENSKSSEIKYLIAAVDSVDDLYEYEKLSDKIRSQYSYCDIYIIYYIFKYQSIVGFSLFTAKSSSLEIGLVPIDDLKSLHLELNENVIHNLDRLTADEILQKIKITSESVSQFSYTANSIILFVLTQSFIRTSIQVRFQKMSFVMH
jgi:hypothetical protein